MGEPVGTADDEGLEGVFRIQSRVDLASRPITLAVAAAEVGSRPGFGPGTRTVRSREIAGSESAARIVVQVAVPRFVVALAALEARWPVESRSVVEPAAAVQPGPTQPGTPQPGTLVRALRVQPLAGMPTGREATEPVAVLLLLVRLSEITAQ